MAGEQNWRPETRAEDYFGNQQKTLDMNNRRPVIRRAADLVGPGIDSAAVRITNFNDPLATFNGYYSAEPTAKNGPTTAERVVGFTVMDTEFGGVQTFTGLATKTRWTRVFTRRAGDTTKIDWGQWETGSANAPTGGVDSYLFSTSSTTVGVPSGQVSALYMPSVTVLGDQNTFQRNQTNITFTRSGIYAGAVRIFASTAPTWTVTMNRPDGLANSQTNDSGVKMPYWIPLYMHVSQGDNGSYLTIAASHGEATTVNASVNRLYLARLGDIPA